VFEDRISRGKLVSLSREAVAALLQGLQLLKCEISLIFSCIYSLLINSLCLAKLGLEASGEGARAREKGQART
jgi:hypothetical protein